MCVLRMKPKVKTGGGREPAHHDSTDSSLRVRGMSPQTGGLLSSFYSAGPVLGLKGLIQPKLTMGQPNDIYEQEADRAADQVMSMPESKGATVQRKPGCPECEEGKEQVQTKPIADQIAPLAQRQVEEEEEKEEVQTKSIPGNSSPVTPGLHSQIQPLRDAGQPLPQSVRDFFEPRFGADFSQVRVHTNSQAADTAKSLDANAFTTGKDIVFGSSQFSPEASTGKTLLAHELTHILQQQAKTGKENRENLIQLRGSSGSKTGSLLASPMIDQINVNVTSPQYIYLTWKWPNEKRLPNRLGDRRQWGGGLLSALGIPGPFTCSTGAGKCPNNCNDTSTSQKNGSMCTPKGGCWVVNPAWTHRKTGSGLNYFVGFQRPTIGLHSNIHGSSVLTVDGAPHSHGCVRLDGLVPQMIYENIWPGYTVVCVYGNWSGSTCWKGKNEVPRKTPKSKDKTDGILV